MLNALAASGDHEALPALDRSLWTTAARPQPGRSLGGAVLGVQAPIRNAVEALSRSKIQLIPEITALFSDWPLGRGAVAEPMPLRLSWLLVNACYLHARTKGHTHFSSLRDSSQWFLGETVACRILSAFSDLSIKAAETSLAFAVIDRELSDLYPYVIEPHGHVSRSCLRSAAARNVRRSKKADGVYYTPEDVADFVVSEIDAGSGNDGAWLDPACGTGVFLRSIIRRAKSVGREITLDFIAKRIFGIDKSALATDCAAFILLMEIDKIDGAGQPVAMWKILKRNVACLDALTLTPNDSNSIGIFDQQLSDVFPHSHGVQFEKLVMNPPYSAARPADCAHNSWHAIRRTRQKVDLHLPFMEMMWRLGTFRSCGAVLPLSVATNTTSSYRKVRGEFLRADGRKELLFFDREPQALFGEDVKTRNSILFRFADCDTSLYTSRLLKWTAEQRPSIFTRARLTEVTFDGSAAIPKVGSKTELELLAKLVSAPATASQAPGFSKMSRSSLANLCANFSSDLNTIAVAGTAYNFLNVFFAKDLRPLVADTEKLSSSPVIYLAFDSEPAASAAYALLASRLAYWLWRVGGDGFHVSVDFIANIPLWRALADKDVAETAAAHGREIRKKCLKQVVRSVNSGRETFAFPPDFFGPEALSIEKVLLEKLAGSSTFSAELDSVLLATLSIDGKDRRSAKPTTKKAE